MHKHAGGLISEFMALKQDTARTVIKIEAVICLGSEFSNILDANVHYIRSL